MNLLKGDEPEGDDPADIVPDEAGTSVGLPVSDDDEDSRIEEV